MLKRATMIMICFLSLASFNNVLFAQTTNVSGTVISSEDDFPVIGATVMIMGQTTGTITDIDGNFTLNDVPSNGLLEISYLGYLTKKVPVEPGKKLTIILEPDAQQLDEVVVVGYGSQRKVEVTGSVARVDSEALTKMSSPDVGSALQGQVAGVNVQMSSGEPGAVANIQIRGISSINGKNQPLYVVDGIPYDGDPGLSPNEIESLDVLKDAASAAIYGTRGAGGVILITTKGGKEGKTQVSVDANYGIQMITSRLYMTNSATTTALAALSTYRDSRIPANEAWQKIKENQTGFADASNMAGIIEQSNQPVTNLNATISGGSKNATYSVIANYFNQEGIVINSGYERVNLRANTELKHNNWTFTANLSSKMSTQTSAANNIYNQVYKYKPTSPVFDPDTEIGTTPGTDLGEKQQMGTTLALFKEKNNNESKNFNGNFSVNYKFMDGLSFTSRIGIGYNTSLRERIKPLFKIYDEDGDLVPNTNTRSSVYRATISNTNMIWENMLNYAIKIDKHDIKATGVVSTEKYTTDSYAVQRYDLISNDIPNIGATTGESIISLPGRLRTTGLFGMLLRAQYSYDSRYMLSASIRRDASSRFAEKNRWGSFPSVSAGWNISEEDFFAPAKDVIEQFKLRLSYGSTGNQNFNDYQYAASIEPHLDYAFGNGNGSNTINYGSAQSKYANADVKWETTQQLNAGIDMSFLDSRLSLTADVYQTTKKDMLLPLLVPLSAGAGNNGQVILNVGDMENKGFEFALGWRESKGDFTYNANFTASRNVNTITEMSGSNTLFALGQLNPGSNADHVTFLSEGIEAGAFMLYPTNGVINTEEKLKQYSKIVPTARMGDLMYVDGNGDNKITDEDRTYHGSGAPEVELGLNLGLIWKNFDVSMIWYSSIGNEVINGSKCASYQNLRHLDLLSSWTANENMLSPIPAVSTGGHDNYKPSTDYWVEDGTYLRLNNFTVGYTIPKNLLEKVGITKLRVYVAGDNALTITKYNGFNPGVGNDGLSQKGVDNGTYPIAAQIRGGVQLNF